MSTWLDVITDAFLEVNIYFAGEPLRPEDQQFATRKLNRIIDRWTARRVLCYSQSFTQYTLTANHAPHSIGPSLTSPDFATVNGAPRPVRIDSASLILTDQTPNVDQPIAIRDKDWWARNRIKGLSSNVPTDLYYEPDFPSGQLNFWPIPAFAYGVRLETWTQISSVPATITTAFSAPPAYESTIVYQLAKELCTPYQKAVPADLEEKLRESKKALEEDNYKAAKIASADYGATGSRGGRRGDFNFYAGGPA